MSDPANDMTLSGSELTETIMLMRAIGVDLQK
jgi:hypothetical protein